MHEWDDDGDEVPEPSDVDTALEPSDTVMEIRDAQKQQRKRPLLLISMTRDSGEKFRDALIGRMPEAGNAFNIEVEPPQRAYSRLREALVHEDKIAGFITDSPRELVDAPSSLKGEITKTGRHTPPLFRAIIDIKRLENKQTLDFPIIVMGEGDERGEVLPLRKLNAHYVERSRPEDAVNLAANQLKPRLGDGPSGPGA